MSGPSSRGSPGLPPTDLDRRGYVIEFDEDFDAPALDASRWLPHYLAHWSSRAASAARYRIADGVLHLAIEADQAPWCPECDGSTRVSSLQTGSFSGPIGSRIGQHRFRPDLVVREEQPPLRLYLPHRGLVEARVRALDDPATMCALWMIGYEDSPERSAEICVFEIFGREVGPAQAVVGLGLHPFGDPEIGDDFAKVVVPIDAREFHEYAAAWEADRVAFYVDEQLVRVVNQSPDYPMQLMLSLYEFADDDGPRDRGAYPREFAVDWVRGYRRA